MYASRNATARSSHVAASIPLFSRVVAGIDFGPASLAAARWAFAHVARDAHGILSHVVAAEAGDDDASRSRSGARAGVRGSTRELIGGLDGFAATLDLATARTVVGVGRPSHWLKVLADDAGASLVVAGRRADANRRRIGEPNVLERLTRRTTASVLVVPEGTATRPANVVVAIDRSAASEHALATAAALAATHGYSLVVLHVLPPPREAGPYQRVIDRRAGRRRDTTGTAIPLSFPSRDARRWMTQLAERVPVSSAQLEITIGDPAREIVATALGLPDAMIVVGKRGDDDSPAGSIGSVARELLTTARVPVLVVDG